MMMYFSTREHFKAIQDSASEESQDQIPLHLLDSTLTLYPFAIQFS